MIVAFDRGSRCWKVLPPLGGGGEGEPLGSPIDTSRARYWIPRILSSYLLRDFHECDHVARFDTRKGIFVVSFREVVSRDHVSGD
jgi:hypothetical protein